MCASHIALRQSTCPDTLLPFWKCYTFGPSTKNQWIEAWWNTLADSLTESWKQFFIKLDKANLFDKESVYNIIALRYIYIDKLREQVRNFVMVHNLGTIRKQKNKDFFILSGVSEELYFFHNRVDNFKTVPEGITEDLLCELEAEIALYNLKEYQSKEIADLCTTLLQLANKTYSLDELHPHLDEDHVIAYNYLRLALRSYENLMDIALKDVNVKPLRGGEYWIMAVKAAERQRKEAIQLDY
jgi:hypothetical protein